MGRCGREKQLIEKEGAKLPSHCLRMGIKNDSLGTDRIRRFTAERVKTHHTNSDPRMGLDRFDG